MRTLLAHAPLYVQSKCKRYCGKTTMKLTDIGWELSAVTVQSVYLAISFTPYERTSFRQPYFLSFPPAACMQLVRNRRSMMVSRPRSTRRPPGSRSTCTHWPAIPRWRQRRQLGSVRPRLVHSRRSDGCRLPVGAYLFICAWAIYVYPLYTSARRGAARRNQDFDPHGTESRPRPLPEREMGRKKRQENGGSADDTSGRREFDSFYTRRRFCAMSWNIARLTDRRKANEWTWPHTK